MKLYNGDCLEVMKKLPDNSVDSIVTDAPYGLKFMGKKWDYEIPSVEIWQEAIRVLKPGGHLLSFGGSRTYHRMAVAIEDAGFEIRDQIMWVYGSGFPKSHNIGKSVDKLQGNEREDLGVALKLGGRTGKNPYQSEDDNFNGDNNQNRVTKGTSPYEGWGTALKPSHEPICMARKPLSEKTIALNVLKWGTGGINIDKCRVEYTGKTDPRTFGGSWKTDKAAQNVYEGGYEGSNQNVSQLGRFPANFIHDGSDEVVGLFPETKSGGNKEILDYDATPNGVYGKYGKRSSIGHTDSGSASRFFYCAKASKKDRNEGLEGFEEGQTVGGGGMNNTEDDVCGKYGSIKAPTKNFHPTVKPTSLMQYLVRLVTPKNGTVLDPFMGSGSTGKACVLEGFDFIGIELDPEYCKIAEARIEYEVGKP